jgi:hypothetical protein
VVDLGSGVYRHNLMVTLCRDGPFTIEIVPESLD